MTRFAPLAVIIPALLACTAVQQEERAAGGTTETEMTTLTAEERAGGWRSLFDGATTTGWRGYKRSDVPNGWRVVDGALTRVGGGGDLITTEQFGNFELSLEWKVQSGGNSGVFYRVIEEGDAAYFTGPEMQVLDDAAHADGKSRLTAAGATYALYPAPAGIVRPAGEWNEARVVANGAQVQHWLNGSKVVEYELWSPEWEQRVRASKFAAWPKYGRAERGHIGIQDHGDTVAFRNIKIKVLP
ncbi:MAG: 3-keto-disaccharide hydrolase [Gemmatimonadaceae bacterium]